MTLRENLKIIIDIWSIIIYNNNRPVNTMFFIVYIVIVFSTGICQRGVGDRGVYSCAKHININTAVYTSGNVGVISPKLL